MITVWSNPLFKRTGLYYSMQQNKRKLKIDDFIKSSLKMIEK